MDLSKIVITDIVSLIHYSPEKRKLAVMKNRPFYGLAFTLDGQITYTANGKTFVSNKNNAVLFKKGTEYTLRGDKKGVFIGVNFECENFEFDTITLLPINSTETIVKEFEQIKKLFFLEKNKLIIFSHFYSILHKFNQQGKESQTLLSPALDYIEKNISADITNAVLAQKCCISEEYFRKQFVKLYGISPKQYVIDVKIQKAKQLLTDGFLKINAISEQCGFSNPYHFCRLFKQKTGFTPTEFMKKNKVYEI